MVKDFTGSEITTFRFKNQNLDDVLKNFENYESHEDYA